MAKRKRARKSSHKKPAKKKLVAKKKVGPRSKAAKKKISATKPSGAKAIKAKKLKMAGAALAKPCVPVLQATQIVEDCAGRPVNVETQLGQVFSEAGRERFCQCVASGARVPRPQVPCSATTTFGQVISAISC